MKILFVANRVPYPPFRGDKLKIYNLAKQLQGEHEIHLLTIAENQDDIENQVHLKSVFNSVEVLFLPKWKSILHTFFGLFSGKPLQVSYFKSAAFQKKINKHIEAGNYDGIHIQHLRMSRFFLNRSREKAILDLPDAFSLYWKRRRDNAKGLGLKLFANLEYKRLLRYEKKVLPLFEKVLVCSQEDQQYLINNTSANVQILPNGVDTDLFSPKADVHAEPGRILFTGNMDYEPNVDAVEYFVTEMLPDILEKRPEAYFVIAGQRPVSRVTKLASEKVIITGFVEDISIEYARATVVIAPLRFGAGTQNKVLEALAVGTPVVCTEVGFKGIGVDSGQGAIMATDKGEFIHEILHLLENPEYRHRVSFAGADLIRSKFGWKSVSNQLLNYFNRV